jgi:hypothetical protein
VTVTGANGCTSTADITLTQNITAPAAGITNNSGTTVLTCTTTSVSVTATGGVSYAWSGGLGSNAGVTITAPGTYTVTVTGTNGCTSTADITITQDVTPPAMSCQGDVTMFLSDPVLTLSGSLPAGGVYSGDGVSNGQFFPAVAGPGLHVITYTVVGANGCVNTCTFNITVNGLIQGTVKPGATANSFDVYLRPQVSNNTQYLFQMGLPIAFPSSASPSTSISIAVDPAFTSNFGNYTTSIYDRAHNTAGTVDYMVVSFTRTDATPQTWTAGTEFKVMTVTFNSPGLSAADFKLADFQDGGSDQQGNFYTADGNNTYYYTTNSVGNFYAVPGVSRTGGDASEGYAQLLPKVFVPLKAWLQGAYSVTSSRHKDVTSGWATILKNNATSQPFTAAPFSYSGTESVPSSVFTSTAGTTDIVDWVLLEFRTAAPPAAAVARKAAFIREDGRIVDLDGVSDVSLDNSVLPAGNYYVTIRHRNHLPVRTATAIAISAVTPLYDFTTAQSKAFQQTTPVLQNPAMKEVQTGVFGMWAGDVNRNNKVSYTGLSNDAVSLLTILGSNQGAILSPVYNAGDLNLDGRVSFTGLNNDAVFLLSVLGANQGAIFTGHQ